LERPTSVLAGEILITAARQSDQDIVLVEAPGVLSESTVRDDDGAATGGRRTKEFEELTGAGHALTFDDVLG
jgi:hypothetical protein